MPWYIDGSCLLDIGSVKSWLRDHRGQAVLEFALILPILLFLLFAIFTVGYWMNAQQIVTQAASQGARQGALTNDNDLIGGAIADNLKAIDPGIALKPPQPQHSVITIDPNDPAVRKHGGSLSVSITYTMPFFFKDLPDKFKTVNATVVSYIQCDPEPPKFVCEP